jgi:hypothetical protein
LIVLRVSQVRRSDQVPSICSVSSKRYSKALESWTLSKP